MWSRFVDVSLDLLPLDDRLYMQQPSIPPLARSALHRCLRRHGIFCLPDIDGDKPRRPLFKRCLFVGIDPTSKFAVAQLVDKADGRRACASMGHRLKAGRYRFPIIQTDKIVRSPSSLASTTPPDPARYAST